MYLPAEWGPRTQETTLLGDCRIVILASPLGVYPAVEFLDGDLRTKSSMVTQRRRDLDMFGPRCA